DLGGHMVRALPVGSEVVAANPAFSALAALGLEESVVQMGLADAPVAADLLDPILDTALPAASVTDAVVSDAVTPASATPAEAPVTVESLDGTGDLTALLPADAPVVEMDANATES